MIHDIYCSQDTKKCIMIKKICTFLKSTVTIPRHAYTNVPSVKWCTFCIILIYKNKMNYLEW